MDLVVKLRPVVKSEASVYYDALSCVVFAS